VRFEQAIIGARSTVSRRWPSLPRTMASRKPQPRQPAPPPRDWLDRLNVVATTMLSCGLLIVAGAQWLVSERQAATAEALRRLEFARSAPRFTVEPSNTSLVLKSGDDARAVILPRTIAVTPVSGVTAVALLDSEVELAVYPRHPTGEMCTVRVRGLYLDERRNLNLFNVVEADFRRLIPALDAEGLTSSISGYNISISFTDLFGKVQRRSYRVGGNDPMETDQTPFDELILYSGAWANGDGFYFDSLSDPAIHCPALAKQLKAAVGAVGGGPGAELPS